MKFIVLNNNIVVGFGERKSDSLYSNELRCDEIDSTILGKRWNGKTFEEVPIEEVEEPETTEVTNEDLLEVLLAIGEKVGA